MAALKSKSLVWSYFERMGEKAKCLQYKPAKILKCCGGSTSALRKHLISVHSINRRMPNCTTVMQKASDILNPKFNQIRLEIANFWLLIGL